MSVASPVRSYAGGVSRNRIAAFCAGSAINARTRLAWIINVPFADPTRKLARSTSNEIQPSGSELS